MNLKKKSIIIICTSLMLLIAGIIIYFYKDDSSKKIVSYSTSQIFDIENHAKLKNQLNTNNDNHQIFALISESCSSCKDFLKGNKLVMELLKDQKISMNYIWDNIPSNNFLNRYGMNRSNHYELNKNVILEKSYPIFYVVHEDKVVLKADEFDQVIDYLTDKNILEKNTSKVNIEHFLKTNFLKSKDDILYFTMEGCKDCDKADEILNHINKSNKTIIRIYTKNSEKEPKDDFGIISHSLDINWYPSFVFLSKGEINIISEENEEKLREKLTNLYNDN